jgi:hypothetical protein
VRDDVTGTGDDLDAVFVVGLLMLELVPEILLGQELEAAGPVAVLVELLVVGGAGEVVDVVVGVQDGDAVLDRAAAHVGVG